MNNQDTHKLHLHIPPYELSFKVAPDYEEVNKKIEILTPISLMLNQGVYIIDYYKQNYLYVSENHFIRALINKTNIKTDTSLTQKLIPKEEQEQHLEMKNAMLLHFSTFSETEQRQMSLFIIHRLIDKKGKHFPIINQYRPIAFDDKGQMWLILVVSNISTRGMTTFNTYVESDVTGERYIYSLEKKKMIVAEKIKLTKQETVILMLSSQGYDTKEMVGRLGISSHTVNFHKKNILIKLNVQSMTEAVAYAYSHNLIIKSGEMI